MLSPASTPEPEREPEPEPELEPEPERGEFHGVQTKSEPEPQQSAGEPDPSAPTNKPTEASSGFVPWVPQCDGCAEQVHPGIKLVRCSRCKCSWYHGKDCQRADYKEHKACCRGLSRMVIVGAEKAKSAVHTLDTTPGEEDVCAICLQAISGGVSLPCKHEYCYECLTDYRRTVPSARCPKCRRDMDEDLLFRDYQDAAMLLRRANCRPEGSVARAQEFVEVAKKIGVVVGAGS